MYIILISEDHVEKLEQKLSHEDVFVTKYSAMARERLASKDPASLGGGRGRGGRGRGRGGHRIVLAVPEGDSDFTAAFLQSILPPSFKLTEDALYKRWRSRSDLYQCGVSRAWVAYGVRQSGLLVAYESWQKYTELTEITPAREISDLFLELSSS